jgi:autotransporter-associated beta strand protein
MKPSGFLHLTPSCRAIGSLLVFAGSLTHPAFAVITTGVTNTYNGSLAANGLGSNGNWSAGAPFNANGTGAYSDLLFTGDSGSTFTGTGGTANLHAESYNVTNGNSYTLQINSSVAASFRTGATPNATGTGELLQTFTNSVSGVAQDLVYLANGSSLTFNATNDGNLVSGELVIGTPATFIIRQTGNFNIGSGSTLTLNPAISGSFALNINGSGTTLINGTNSSTAAINLNGGTLKLGSATALGTTAGTTTVASGAVLDLNGRAVGGEPISLSGTGISSGGALVNTGGAASLAGTVTLNANSSIGGAGDITLGNVAQSGTRALTKVGAGTLTLGGTISYTGTTTVSQGALEISGTHNGTGATFVRNGMLEISGTHAGTAYTVSQVSGEEGEPVLKLSNVTALPAGAKITGADSVLRDGIVDLAIAGDYTLSAYDRGNITFTASGGSPTSLTFTDASIITAGANTVRTFTNASSDLSIVFASTLDIGGDVAANVTIAGAGDTTVTGGVTSTGSGVRGLIKNGGGTLALNSAGSYTGTTHVNDGTLRVNNTTGSATGSGDVNIAADATLGGSGIIAGATTTIAGTLAPGNSPGALTIDGGTLALGIGGDYAFEIYDALGDAGIGYDTTQLSNGATLNLGSLATGSFTINLQSLASLSPGAGGDATGFNNASAYSWTLFSTGSVISGFDAGDFVINDTGFSNALGGGSFSVGLADSNTDIVVNFTPIPEPRAALLGALGLLALLRRRRVL